MGHLQEEQTPPMCPMNKKQFIHPCEGKTLNEDNLLSTEHQFPDDWMQNGFNPESKRSRQLTCVVSPEVPQRGAAAPSVQIKSPSADSTGVFVPVTGDNHTAGSSSLHAASQDPIQGATCKGQRKVPKYQRQGQNPVWSAKRQKREKEKSPPNHKILPCFQSHEKQHWTPLCDIHIYINLSKAPEILTQILVSVRLGQEHSWN